MNNQETLNIPEPDPGWDYYVIWHSLLHHKAQIDAALKMIKDSEESTAELDEDLHDLLDKASDNLIEVVISLEPKDN